MQEKMRKHIEMNLSSIVHDLSNEYLQVSEITELHRDKYVKTMEVVAYHDETDTYWKIIWCTPIHDCTGEIMTLADVYEMIPHQEPMIETTFIQKPLTHH